VRQTRRHYPTPRKIRSSTFRRIVAQAGAGCRSKCSKPAQLRSEQESPQRSAVKQRHRLQGTGRAGAHPLHVLMGSLDLAAIARAGGDRRLDRMFNVKSVCRYFPAALETVAAIDLINTEAERSILGSFRVIIDQADSHNRKPDAEQASQDNRTLIFFLQRPPRFW